MNILSNIHHWKEPDTRDVKTFIHDYFMSGKEFPEWEMQDTSPVNEPGNAVIKQYVWIRKGHADRIFKIDIVASFSYEEAKIQFGEILQQNMRPLNELKKVEPLLGSNAYVDDIEEMHYGLFLFANMVIKVHSVGHTSITCNDFIKTLYRILTYGYKAQTVPGTTDSSDRIFSSVQGNVISVAEHTVLNIQTPVWYKLVLEGPGAIRLQNGNLQYSSDERGTAHVHLYIIGDNTVVKNTLTLTVK